MVRRELNNQPVTNMKNLNTKLIAVLILGIGYLGQNNTSGSFASEVIDYNPGNLPASLDSYKDPQAALGEPSRVTPGDYGGPVDPFSPPYLSSQVVAIGSGGHLTVRLSAPAKNDPLNPFGLDFIIFGNAGFIITNGDYTGGGITDGSLFGANAGTTIVEVSQDNTKYYQLNSALAPVVDGLFPTDGSGDFSIPVDPSLKSSDFSGKDLKGIRSLYNGSGGGTGFDIAWTGIQDLTEINYIRVSVVDGHSEIDGFSTVAAVPEPTSWLLLAIGLGLVFNKKYLVR
jgi:hypothetical protein